MWEDADANIAKVSAMLADASVERGDLVVLPEMYNTGFSLNTDVTNDADRRSRDAIAGWAERYGAYVLGSVTVLAENGRARNRCVVAGPDGTTLATYDKIHPFSFGREGERFDGGGAVETFRWNDALTVCPTICYDLRFPELYRVGLSRGAEVFTVIANWPSPRANHWRALLIARAIENQAFVIGVNRSGEDPHLRYSGDSLVVDPRGSVLAEAGASEGLVSCGIDPASVERWRETFLAWKDRKAFLLAGREDAFSQEDSAARADSA